MKHLHVFIFISICLATSSAMSSIEKCSEAVKRQRCLISIDLIHPTQFSLGLLSTYSKIPEIEKAFMSGRWIKFLKSKVAPAIIGPDKLFYITDRHHTSYSIYLANIPKDKKELIIEVVDDWSHMSLFEFSKKMKSFKYAWLKDENYTNRKFSELPTHIQNLKDDPYRSLAWKVRKLKGFKKVNISFLEFFWADFFKKNGIHPLSSSVEDINAISGLAFSLSRSTKASHLPGYTGMKGEGFLNPTLNL